MIISRSPLRISLGGGGTDLPSYYREHGGFLIAAAIDKAVYVTVHRTFLDEMVIRYSQIERVPGRHAVRHPIVREALGVLGIEQQNLEITSMADIPAGAVLGSGKLDEYGKLLHEHWERKRRRSAMISSPRIDHWYDAARKNGATGGKLIGAGGGGFLMFLADDPRRLRKAMEAEGLPELRFGFDYQGTRILQ